MNRNRLSVLALFSIFFFDAATADVVEIKLVDAQDEEDGEGSEEGFENADGNGPDELDAEGASGYFR